MSNNVETVNEIKKQRVELMRQLETLMRTRAQRHTYLSKDMNRQIHKLESQIHKMTIQHREEIKKCYSGTRSSATPAAAPT